MVGRPMWEVDFWSSPEAPKKAVCVPNGLLSQDPPPRFASSSQHDSLAPQPLLSLGTSRPSPYPDLLLGLPSAALLPHQPHRLDQCVRGLQRMAGWVLGASGSLWAGAPTFRQNSAASLGAGRRQ